MTPNELIESARCVLEHAHAPYSKYKVGAALLCMDGTVFQGCNVENASFGLTNCAERTAVFSAIAAGQTSFKAIALTSSSSPTPFPCGACRQVLAEFCPADLPVYIADGVDFKTTTLGNLFPMSFSFEETPDAQ